MATESAARLLTSRQQIFHQFEQRAETLYEMLDALVALPSATAPAYRQPLVKMLDKR